MNFTKAAADLCISQPAVTAQMKAFEQYCGLKLIKRKGRKNWLTEEGDLLYDYARKIFSIEQKVTDVLADMRQLKRGTLRVGTTKAYARYFMPLMLSSFHNNYPNIKIELNEGSSLEMTRSLLKFKNEVAIIAKAEDTPGISFIPFSQEEMVAIAAPDHPLSRGEAIHFSALKDQPFIMKDKGSGTRRLVDKLFAGNNTTPEILMEVSNPEFIKQLVERGEGISYLIREAVASEIETGRLAEIPLQGEKVYLDVSIAYLEDQHLSPSARAFLDTLEKLQYRRGITPQGIGNFMARILSQQKQKQSSSKE